jgi:hypothetical protein
MMGWHDIEYGQTLDSLRLIQRHAKANASAPIVACDHKLIKAQRIHEIKMIFTHGAKAITTVIVSPIGFGAITIAAQIRRDHRKMLG